MNKSRFALTLVIISVLLISFSTQPVFSKEQEEEGNLLISEVFIDCGDSPTIIDIYGQDLNNGTEPLSITLGEFALLDLVILIDEPDHIRLQTTDSLCDFPGNYTLYVSRGNGQPERDDFEVTLGAVGPQGPQGEQGPPGEPRSGCVLVPHGTYYGEIGVQRSVFVDLLGYNVLVNLGNARQKGIYCNPSIPGGSCYQTDLLDFKYDCPVGHTWVQASAFLKPNGEVHVTFTNLGRSDVGCGYYLTWYGVECQ